jgi:hypothetical protein
MPVIIKDKANKVIIPTEISLEQRYENGQDVVNIVAQKGVNSQTIATISESGIELISTFVDFGIAREPNGRVKLIKTS